MDEKIAFNGRAVFTFAPDRMYRIYVLPGELCFIKVGGQGVFDTRVSSSLRTRLGLMGFLLGLFGRKNRERIQKRSAGADSQDPRSLLPADKKNFLAKRGDFLATSIDPPRFATHGEHHGIWRFKLRSNRTFNLQFESLEDMKAALEHLPRFFYPRMRVNAVWSDNYQMYVKKK